MGWFRFVGWFPARFLPGLFLVALPFPFSPGAGSCRPLPPLGGGRWHIRAGLSRSSKRPLAGPILTARPGYAMWETRPSRAGLLPPPLMVQPTRGCTAALSGGMILQREGIFMTQRQFNMIMAMEDGLRTAKRELTGPGSDLAIEKAMKDLNDNKPSPMSLAATAYYTAMYIAWKERGFPGEGPRFPAFD